MKRSWTGLVLGLLASAAGGCGSSENPVAPAPPAVNRPPDAAIRVSPAGQAIVGVTSLTFSAQATDPDGDSLTYSWNLGNGVSASGPTASRGFDVAGGFEVTLTVTDARGAAATARAQVTARSLSGSWIPIYNGVRGDRAGLEQDGASLSAWADVGCCKHYVAGELSHPRNVTAVLAFSGCKRTDIPFTGTVNETLDRVSLRGENCSGFATTFEFVRP